MKQIVTRGIVLARTNFQEADRIITVLTPDHGKVRLMAKGVRRERSKLAGGIELFSVSNITFLPGRKEIGTLVSSRLKQHFGEIVKDINRTMLGYDILKRMNRLTEDAAGEEYFEVLEAALAGLNNQELAAEMTELWFTMQLLKITGHSPNLSSDVADGKLESDKEYLFEYDSMAFRQQKGGPFKANHIKLLRLCISTAKPESLTVVKNTDEVAVDSLKIAKSMLGKLVRL